MAETCEMRIIARIRTDFPTKFGIPRQSGLAESLRATVVFEPEFRNADALRGLEGFSHLWLIWQFSQSVREGWSPTVRPPKLGGNTRVGVFATRSPFRPSPIGLSSVRLEGIEMDAALGPVLRVMGADLMDLTPILDIKPYLPYTDSHPDAALSFAAAGERVRVRIPPELMARIPEEKRAGLVEALSQDPRPGYQHAPDRVYGVPFSGLDVRFTVADGVLQVCQIERLGE